MAQTESCGSVRKCPGSLERSRDLCWTEARLARAGVSASCSILCFAFTISSTILTPDTAFLRQLMSYNPKTPSRSSRQRARSLTKTPLTASGVSAVNGYSLHTEPSKSRADLTNPFWSTSKVGSSSRATSPAKRATSGTAEVTERLRRQASNGLIRKGGVESRLDVVTRDYVPPPPKKEVRRSKSQPCVSRLGSVPLESLTCSHRETLEIASLPHGTPQ